MIMVNFTDKYRQFTEKNNVVVSGNCFVGDELLSNEGLINDLDSIQSSEQIENKLNQYIGFYAFVINHGNECFAAVDHVRSIPLFYSRKDESFYISNDAEWVHQQVDERTFDPLAEQDFLSFGYVMGQDTLFKQVKQLQAGEYLHFSENKKELTIKRYYRFFHIEPETIKEKTQYHQDLGEVLDKTIKRLISYAGGRQIVIPLSSGHDSRLITLKLKQHGYENVLCFSYGIAGNFEAQKSMEVARILGFRWEFVEYTDESWKEWLNSTEMENYFILSCNFCSLPHIQDWPAVFELKKKQFISQDAVFVPGHTDFFPGGVIPFDAELYMKKTTADLADYIVRHKTRNYMDQKKLPDKDSLITRILNSCENLTIADSIDYVSGYEKWFWEENIAKFIVNSVRVYEFWGVDWWLPLSDFEYVRYWQNMPLQCRIRRRVYWPYIDDLFEKITGAKSDDSNKSEKYKYIKLKALLVKYKLYYPLKEIKYIFNSRLKMVSGGVCGFIMAYSEQFIHKNISRVNSVNGLLGIFTLDYLKKKIMN